MKIKKTFRFDEGVLDKLEQLVQAKNFENEKFGIPSYNNTEMIEQSISFMHSHTFGKDVMDSTVQKLEVIISSAVKLSLTNYVDQFARSLNRLNYNDDKMIESIFLLMMANGMIPDNQETVNELIQKTDYIHDMIDHAIKIKEAE